MSYYVVVSYEDSIPRERLQPMHERVSLLARKQGGAPFDCFDFTKRETPPLGSASVHEPRGNPTVRWLSSPLFCVFIFGAPTEEGCVKTLSVLSLGL